MKLSTSVNDPEIIEILRAGGVGVLRTDTLYGIVALADDETAVRRVYELKGRDDTKSPIVLIDSPKRLYDTPDEKTSQYINSVWPGPVSVIVSSMNAPDWITRGNGSVAYRMPDDRTLLAMLAATGPLIAPSANPQGEAPAVSIDEAHTYFGDAVDFYIDGGVVRDATPSKLVRIEENGEQTRLR